MSIATLAVGLGINAAMFGVLDALLLRPPFHIEDPSKVVAVNFQAEGRRLPVDRTNYPTFVALRESGAFRAVAANMNAAVSIGSGPGARIANAMLASNDFFEVLRPRPHLGTVSLSHDVLGTNAAVVSYSFWLRHFAGQVGAVGASLDIDRRPYTVVGVAPEGFRGLGTRPIDIWLPLDHLSTGGIGPRNWRDNTGPLWLYVVARLHQETPVDLAQVQATTFLTKKRLGPGNDDRPQLTVVTNSIVPGRGSNKSLENRVSIWLAGVSGLVLLIACANVSNLVLARTISKRSDYAILLAIGASRGDLIRRGLFDALVLVGLGTAAAITVSFILRNAIASLLTANIPLSRGFWDPRAIGILACSAAAAFGFIVVASVGQLYFPKLSTNGLHRESTGKHSSLIRRSLLSVQAALCLCLLFLAGLFASSLSRVEGLDLGVDVDRTVQLTINLAGLQRSAADNQRLFEGTRDELLRHPSIERVALADASPYLSGSGASPWTDERSASELWSNREVAYRSVVGAGFFAAVGANSLRGRDFNEYDRLGNERVAIINETLARYLWPNRDALGQCMWLDDHPTCLRIVGVLEGVWKFSALSRDKMTVYLPLEQMPTSSPGVLFIRPRGDARRILPEAVAIVQRMHKDLPAARGLLLRDAVDQEFKPWRLGATVFAAFGLVALVIAIIGVYGLVTVDTASRTKEISIRICVGATPSRVIGLVIREGLVAILFGLMAGAAISLFAARWLGGVLFETSPRDPFILATTAALLFTVSLMAVIAPTLRALATDPASILKAD